MILRPFYAVFNLAGHKDILWAMKDGIAGLCHR